jgi:hypothetical protein
MKGNLNPKIKQPGEIREGRLIHLPPEMWEKIDFERLLHSGVNEKTGRPNMSTAKYLEWFYGVLSDKTERRPDKETLQAYESLRERMKAGRPAPVLVPDDLKLNL